MISDSILESDEEDNEEEIENKRGRPLAKLCILKNKHIPEAGEWLTDVVFTRDLHNLVLLKIAFISPTCGKCVNLAYRGGNI